MSFVTNILIQLDFVDTEILDCINKFCVENEYPPFRLMDSHGVGGNKNFEANIYAGAFNYFNTTDFMNLFYEFYKDKNLIGDEFWVALKEQSDDYWKFLTPNDIIKRKYDI